MQLAHVMYPMNASVASRIMVRVKIGVGVSKNGFIRFAKLGKFLGFHSMTDSSIL